MSFGESAVSDHWILAYDNEGEVYTNLEPTRENIEHCLSWFNGTTTFGCDIGRGDVDTMLRCFGEPDRRFIEGMRDGSSFVVRKEGPVGGTRVPVRHGAGPGQSFLVDPSEVLTPAEALRVMLFFRETE
jgi:hypothetical protein